MGAESGDTKNVLRNTQWHATYLYMRSKLGTH